MLAPLIIAAERHCTRSGGPTSLPRLVVWTANAPGDPVPALFEPTFYVMLQGAKRMTLGGDTFDVRAGACAVAAVGLPFVSQVTQASVAQPYYSMQLRLDAGILADLTLAMPDSNEGPCRSFSLTSIEESFVAPFKRLVALLDTPEDLKLLAAPTEREFYYRLLQSPLGGTLRQIGKHSTRFAQIRAAADWIGANADQPMRIDELAGSVGMSVTSFHRHFKAVTAYSPLAYQRHIRLLEARRRLASGTAGVTQIAFAVGYASPAQFSREYKRTFGVPPVRDAAALRDGAYEPSARRTLHPQGEAAGHVPVA